MYPSDWITVKEYSDGTRWCSVKNKNIPVQIFSGKIGRENVDQAEKAADDIFTAHAQDNPFYMIGDLRKLQGLTGYIRQNTGERFNSFSKDRKYYFALVINDTLPNRLMTIFLSFLGRMHDKNIAIKFFYDPDPALAWLESQSATVSRA